MKNFLVRFLFLIVFLWGAVLSGWAEEAKTEEAAAPEGIEQVSPEIALPEYQLLNCRYSLGKEKDRLVFDLNKPCAYEVKFNEAKTEISILLNASDLRKVKKITAKDKAVYAVKAEPYSLDESKTMIRIFLNYRVPVKVMTLGEPDRLVVDVEKLFSEEQSEDLGHGVVHRSIYSGTVYGPLHIELAEAADWSRAEAMLGIARKDGRFSRSTLSSLAKQNKALAAINGGYFSSAGQPLGILVAEGKLLTYPYAARTALLIKDNGKMEISSIDYQEKFFLPDGRELTVDGLNKVRSADQLIVYDRQKGTQSTGTNDFGWEVAVQNGRVIEIGAGNLTIPENGYVLSAHGIRKSEIENLALDDRLTRERKFIPDWTSQRVKYILGGGPRLVKNGKKFITSEAEKFKADIARGRAPRSALGLTKEGHLLLVAVSGRQPDYSVGFTLNELADYLLSLGAVEAMNLDGGGSTAFWAGGRIVNQPSDGQERRVSNILLLKGK